MQEVELNLRVLNYFLLSFDGQLCTFVWVLSLLSRYCYHSYKENYHVYCRNAHSDWQNTEAFRYVIGKSNTV